MEKCLINPTRKECLDREPLLGFSFYLSDRNNAVLSLADEIILNLDKGFSKSPLTTEPIGRASASMWFWVLGAYEIVRTISQAKDCFSESFVISVNELKKSLATVRMPCAKMEQKNKKKPVNSNRSPDGWDFENKDLLVGDPENPISAKLLLKEYYNVLTSLKTEDIFKKHEDSSYYL